MKQIEEVLAEAGSVPVGDLAARAAEATIIAADRRGLVEVAYSILDSPLGPMVAAATSRGLVRLAFGQDPGPVLEDLARRISPRLLEAPRKIEEIRRRLDEYFEGKRKRFGLPIDWKLSDGFYRRVLQATATIPYGRVATYREVATKAGNSRASRAAGGALGSNPIPIVVPCHRVVRTGGDLGGYGGGIERKIALLRLEGALASEQ